MTKPAKKTKATVTAKDKDARRASVGLYMAEMQTWIKQNDNRRDSCDATLKWYQTEISSLREQIELCKKGMALEREQKRIIGRRIARAKQEMRLYLAKQ